MFGKSKDLSNSLLNWVGGGTGLLERYQVGRENLLDIAAIMRHTNWMTYKAD